MLRHLRTLLGDLLRSERGLAALEFALLLPLLLLCLAGVTDLSMAVITGRRLTVAAQDVATIASTMAVQAGSLGSLTGEQAWQATTAPFALFPSWLAPQPGPFAITLSGVNFTAAGRGFNAATQWSVANPTGGIALRPCGSLGPVPDDSTITLTTLPASVFGPTSLLVADVSTVFTPLFSGIFLGDIPMSRSAFISPRVNNGVALSGNGPARTELCPP